MPENSRSNAALPADAIAHYDESNEAGRLEQGAGRLEYARTRELLTRFLPSPPARVLDVGGGPGAYAFDLAGAGYEVHLVDAVPRHVEQARDASARRPDHPLASMAVGDARDLDHDGGSMDAVLLLGPLYHITDRDGRVRALSEAARVLRDGGIVMAAAISRFASLLDGLVHGLLDDPAFAKIVERDLRDGQHRNPTQHLHYFTTAFLHHPDDLASEMGDAGLAVDQILAIEGPGWILQDFDAHWSDADRRERLLAGIRRVESERSLLGVSAHMMGVGRRR